MNTDVRIKRIFCNKCGGLTRHMLRAEYHQVFDSSKYEEMYMDFADGYWEIWQCQGCEEIAFLESWSLEGEEPSESFFPERATKLIKEKSFKKIPSELNSIYTEVIRSFNSGCYILCTAGLRALLEGICLNKGIHSGPTTNNINRNNLEGKINGLKAIIPVNIADNLHGFRFLGNKALHELEVPSGKDIALAIEVIEDVLNVIYELDYKSGRLMELVSRRTAVLSATQIQYREFWESLLASFKQRLPEVTKSKPLPQSWHSIPMGYGGIHLEWAFHGRPRGQFEVGLHLERSDILRNREIIHKLEAEVTQLELEIGEKLIFQEQWGSKWSRVYTIRNEGKMTEELKAWAVETIIRFYKAFKPRLDKILKAG